MKKMLLLALPLICVSFLMASHLTPNNFTGDFQLNYGGEFRTRAIMNNDVSENDGGWFDNRLRLNIEAKLAEKLAVIWSTEVGDITWADFSSKNVNIETNELYLDYQMNWMDMKVRLGQQYWYDHRALVLDDYFSGISADLEIGGIPAELGFIKYYEGTVNTLDDAHVAFANFLFKAPVDWGLTAMFGQQHDEKKADFWVIPYFMLNFEPLMLDLTAVINHKMFKDALGEDDSEMGMAFAVEANADLGVKLGLDVLYVDDKGINTLSPYYENGLYLFGNKLDYDGVQINSDFNWFEQTYMSVVGNFAYPVNDRMEVVGAVGMSQAEEPIGMEFNLGVNCKVYDKLMFSPVIAVGQTGDQLVPNDGNMVYMLGALLKAQF